MERSQSGRTLGSSAEIKVDVKAAFGQQVKNPSKSEVFGITGRFQCSAAGALHATWAKLPQTLVFEEKPSS